MSASVSALRQQPAAESISVKVSYGPNSQDFHRPVGARVDSVLADPFVKEVVGFSGEAGETLFVNGEPATPERVLVEGDHLEVIKPAGEKG